MKLFYISMLLLMCCFTSQAQHSEKIETDRPDQTETPYIVPKKYFQAEAGINAESYHNGLDQVLHPATLLKYGLSNRLELRLEATPLTQMEQYIPATKTTTLLKPIELGTKIRLFEAKGWRPKTSVIFHTAVPFFASKQFRSDPFQYTISLAFQNSLFKDVDLGYNVGIETGESTRYFYTLSPGFSIGENWYAYIENFGQVTEHQLEENFDGGLAYYITKNTKADVSAGFGVGNSSLKYYVALGFSFRLPL